MCTQRRVLQRTALRSAHVRRQYTDDELPETLPARRSNIRCSYPGASSEFCVMVGDGPCMPGCQGLSRESRGRREWRRTVRQLSRAILIAGGSILCAVCGTAPGDLVASRACAPAESIEDSLTKLGDRGWHHAWSRSDLRALFGANGQEITQSGDGSIGVVWNAADTRSHRMCSQSVFLEPDGVLGSVALIELTPTKQAAARRTVRFVESLTRGLKAPASFSLEALQPERSTAFHRIWSLDSPDGRSHAIALAVNINPEKDGWQVVVLANRQTR